MFSLVAGALKILKTGFLVSVDLKSQRSRVLRILRSRRLVKAYFAGEEKG
jgi:hypothetical protein